MSDPLEGAIEPSADAPITAVGAAAGHRGPDHTPALVDAPAGEAPSDARDDGLPDVAGPGPSGATDHPSSGAGAASSGAADEPDDADDAEDAEDADEADDVVADAADGPEDADDAR